MKLRNYLLAGLGVTALVVSAHAQAVVNVLFSNEGTYAGASAYASSAPTDFWNLIGSDPDGNLPTAVGGLLRVDGTTATAIGYTEETGVTGQFMLGGLPNPGGLIPFADYAHPGSGGPLAITISGLVANSAYDLYVYAGRDLDYFTPGAVESSSITLGTTTLTTTYSGPQISYSEGVNYVRFLGATDANGQIVFTATGIVNGFTVAGPAVPEPATYAALFGAVALAGALWRRRHGTA